MDWCRGILAATAHLDDLAVGHLRDALTLERRIEAPLLQARTSAWLAAVLHRRADPADAAEVEQLTEDATRLAVPAGTANSVRRVLVGAGLPVPG